MTNIDYRRAFKIACELLNGNVLYGVDADDIFVLMMQKDGVVSNSSYEEYILNHLQDLDQGQYASSSEIPTSSDNLSSGLENGSPIIDWNNCHTSEQLDSIATTKNDLGVEKIVDVLGSYTDLDIPYKRKIAENILTKLSSVTPIRPKGHWIPVYQGDEIINYRCSECEFGNTFGKGTIGMNFCPRCGANNR